MIDSVREMIEVAEKADCPFTFAIIRPRGSATGEKSKRRSAHGRGQKKGPGCHLRCLPLHGCQYDARFPFSQRRPDRGNQGVDQQTRESGKKIESPLICESGRKGGGMEEHRHRHGKERRNKRWEGKNVAEMAAGRKTDEASALMDMCLKRGGGKRGPLLCPGGRPGASHAPPHAMFGRTERF